MYPLLFSWGPVTIYNFSVFLILSWIVFSFLFWRSLRANGVEEDRIFDLTFYATVMAFVVARIAFVATHWELFSETWLKIVAIWVQPGLSLYGAIVGGVATLVSMSRTIKVRLGMVLDALAVSLPVSFIVGWVGGFLDGTVAGKMADLPWAMRVIGHVGKRHPVALYEIAALIVCAVLLILISRKATREKWPYGVVGVWFFLLYSPLMWILEVFKDSRVYWSLTANQWVLVALFAEALGALYVRGGGREATRPFLHKVQASIRVITGGIYAKLSKRRSE
jgi:phosphatidylglycerol---prolipoprotein diacylglyceryl transferase